MNNISLKKVTLFVAIAALTSPFANANANDISQVKSVVKQVSSTQLIAQFDQDKNGQLNEAEINASGNKKLHQAFKNIDSNNDAAISEKELSDFLAKVKTDKNLLVKNK
jgi:Ca2+-binding EF-hand superfamily protein